MSWQRGYGEATLGSDARPVNRGRMVTLSQGELMDLEQDGKTRANRAFTYAAVIFLALGFGAGKAFGETISIGSLYTHGEAGQATTVTITPSDVPGQFAIVTLTNNYVNQGSDDGIYTVTMDGVAFGVEFQWDFEPVLGSDRITITPPAGITCDPQDCGVTVMEGMAGSVVLFDFMGF